MTKREAIRRLEHRALEEGRKRNHYVKRALLEFLDRNEHLLDSKPPHRNGFSIPGESSLRPTRAPQFAELIRDE